MCPFQPQIGQAEENYYPNTNLFIHTFPSYGIQVPYSRVIRRISPISAYPLLGGGFCS